MRGCYEMIYADAHVRYGQSVSISLEPVSACGSRGNTSEWLGQSPTELPKVGLRLSTPRPRRRRSAKSGLEGNSVWYGQEKKLWVNMTVSICLLPSVYFSHTYRSFDAKKNKEIYIFMQESHRHYFSLYIHFL